MKQALEEVRFTVIYPNKTVNSTSYKNQVQNPLKEFMWFIREHAKILYAELFLPFVILPFYTLKLSHLMKNLSKLVKFLFSKNSPS